MRKIQVQSKYLVIDLETSGIRPWENAIIQIGALALDSELDIVASFNKFVKFPENKKWDLEAAKVHGLTVEFLEKNGINHESLGSEFLSFVKDNFKDKPILIGQFLPFDYSFLDMVFEEAFPDTGLFQNVLSRNFIDTKSLASFYNLLKDIEGSPSMFVETSLSKPSGLIDTLGLKRQDYNSHDALGDCMATRDVLLKLVDLVNIDNLQ